MSRIFRRGAVGALMDEYERAASELTLVVDRTSETEFLLVRDKHTRDEQCRSIQTVVSHVVQSGYSYANYLREAFSLPFEKSVYTLLSRTECLDRLKHMIAYTAGTLDNRWDDTDDQMMAVNIRSRWGQQYDMEQMLEHAIVHILRHRRQIERFLLEQSV
jgi:uncharacterized damage-inducible protein DinB